MAPLKGQIVDREAQAGRKEINGWKNGRKKKHREKEEKEWPIDYTPDLDSSITKTASVCGVCVCLREVRWARVSCPTENFIFGPCVNVWSICVDFFLQKLASGLPLYDSSKASSLTVSLSHPSNSGLQPKGDLATRAWWAQLSSLLAVDWINNARVDKSGWRIHFALLTTFDPSLLARPFYSNPCGWVLVANVLFILGVRAKWRGRERKWVSGDG